MIESELYYLVKSYRDAIEQAHKKNRFCNKNGCQRYSRTGYF